jgi:hypothetical protein
MRGASECGVGPHPQPSSPRRADAAFFPATKSFPFLELQAMMSRSDLKRGGEIGARQKVRKRRNETLVKLLKTHDSAKWLIRLNQ